MKQKVTIRDVAKYAGVSPATVSYVINGVNKVSAETIERVTEAIKELNYQPDFTAISLSKRKSNMIGVMIPSEDDSLAAIFKGNHYYSELISGIEYEARNRGYDFLISGKRNPQDCKNWAIKRNLDGLIFLNSFSDKLYNAMKTLSVPINLIDIYENSAAQYTHIRIDEEQGGKLAAQHLLSLGHKSIGFVATEVKGAVNRKRLLGFQQALGEAGIELEDANIFKTEANTFESGYQTGLEISRSDKNITAIFTTADILALGVIKGLREEGKSVPGDCSVVGFDDLIISTYASPSLTTIRQDVYHKGVLSAKTLIDAIELQETKPLTITLPVELVIRESTAQKTL